MQWKASCSLFSVAVNRNTRCSSSVAFVAEKPLQVLIHPPLAHTHPVPWKFGNYSFKTHLLLLTGMKSYRLELYWETLWETVENIESSGSFVCMCCAHLDHSEQTLIRSGVCGDGEASGGVSGDDAVHGAPGWRVRLVFIRHSQVSHDHIDPVLMDLSEELTQKTQRHTAAERHCKMTSNKPILW